ncbi:MULTISPECIES: hypothetical protein [Gordonia]|uniref:Uncharacterized protein n=2 Tax=Gordonia TaxID=2053 RepID=L7LIV6_9ACTN|nr:MULTISPECIES: hypothetical protein [Gordonia]AUH68737.1 hypothetical protein CXX93_10670 [Gordonia sp. YC-JH1]KXT58023.1 hypothetical protein Y710_05470 [Gordonia sp. QH-12]GAC59973.1 hypothetical protein GSI01S_06_01300 [Gordonia sihwensis NBRC 108236]
MVSWKLPWRSDAARAPEPVVGDPDLRVVVSGTDETVASSVALAQAGFASTEAVVLRHVVRLPASAVGGVLERVGADGYAVDESPVDERVVAAGPDAADDALTTLALARVMPVDAVALSRERARIASMVSRAEGAVVGWAVLRPAGAGEAGAPRR